jgi:hypothetical protein
MTQPRISWCWVVYQAEGWLERWEAEERVMLRRRRRRM